MGRFNFNELKLSEKADITKVQENFDMIEQNGALKSEVDSKAPISHANANNTYGVGTESLYGHCKTVNNLNESSYVEGKALSAYQGKVISDELAKKQKSITSGLEIPTGGTNGDIYIQYFD